MSELKGWEAGFYNSYSKQAGFLRLTVFWDSTVARGEPTGYKFTVGNLRGTRNFHHWQEAALEAEKLACRELQKSLSVLEGEKCE